MLPSGVWPAKASPPVANCNLDLQGGEACNQGKFMWDFFYRSVVGRIEHLDQRQTELLILVTVFVGFWCMRGFGSRSSY
jgi:hypothetical protein